MYGYSFGAAKADVWHKYHTTAMIYPGYLPIGAPFSVGVLLCARDLMGLSHRTYESCSRLMLTHAGPGSSGSRDDL